MTATNGWDLTVPDDAHELLAELRRHGVEPGHKVHVVPDTTPVPADPVAPSAATGHRLSFTGALKGAEPDLAARTDEYVAEGFGRH